LKYSCVLFLFLIISVASLGQEKIKEEKNSKKFYFYWGWNRSNYTKSNINFTGENYSFNLKKAVAKDRQSKFSFNTYFNPVMATIPQYNFRIGYYINSKWDLSIGIDHMKYVLQQNQQVIINGFIDTQISIYDGVYENQIMEIKGDLIEFEHTDGLNYGNIELRHSINIFDFEKINITCFQGFGVGIMIPRTNTTLLGKTRYDEFHLSGFGTGLVGGIKISFFDNFFIQSELKSGFINLPKVRTTTSKNDLAKHHFFFNQFNVVFGGHIKINK
jgi:hypothetical protein